MDVVERSKPRRIKALLSSFLRRDQEPEINSTSDPASHSESDAPSTPQESKVSVTITPLNRESFLQRVDSFSTSTWFAKPHSLSPLHCARYGWKNVDVDSLSCVSCKQVLYVSLPHPWQKEEYSLSCDKVKEKLISTHGNICPWPESPSPESFVKISMVHHKQQVALYHQRVSDLTNITKHLPRFDFSVLADQNEEDAFILKSLREYTMEKVESGENVDEDEWNMIILLALFGWQKSGDPSLPVVSCECCRKQAGLWNYTQRKADTDVKGEENVDEKQKEEDVEPPQKRIKKVNQSTFNPAVEHRPWCPWLLPSSTDQNLATQEDDNFKPAWQLLLDVLLSKANPSKFGTTSPLTNKTQTPPSSAWKAVRRIVSFWQSNETPQKAVPKT
ncbi:zinc finger C3HC-type protein 1-like [Apostichopus japonicus]|uniref:zinc finger C3HC-type protein 1-like n=1 Tax=Stichopus japonicus TaxID=307972 RepID=UPI003AB4830D